MNRYTRKLALASAISLLMVTSMSALAAPEPLDEIAKARLEAQMLTIYALNPHLGLLDFEVDVANGVVITMVDITATKNLEQRLRDDSVG